MIGKIAGYAGRIVSGMLFWLAVAAACITVLPAELLIGAAGLIIRLVDRLLIKLEAGAKREDGDEPSAEDTEDRT